MNSAGRPIELNLYKASPLLAATVINAERIIPTGQGQGVREYFILIELSSVQSPLS